MKNKQEGVTLIALIITIIVLLILAGVTIAMIMGDNGILNRATEAADATKSASEEEEKNLENLEDQMDSILDGRPIYNDQMKKLKQGDYVIYDTGVDGVGEIVCRVLYDASSEYGVQIISDCIKENGEYVKITFGVNSRDYANNEYKEKTLEMYNDAIKTLNTNAIKYLNSSYAIDARCVGSNPIDKNFEPSDYAENTWGEDFGVKIEDNNYETDYNTLSSLEMIETEEPYWLASRYIEYEDLYGGSNVNRVICYVRMVGQEALPIYKDGWGIYWLDYSNEVTNGIRPVFLLRGDLNIVSGDGKSESTAYRFN